MLLTVKIIHVVVPISKPLKAHHWNNVIYLNIFGWEVTTTCSTKIVLRNPISFQVDLLFSL